MQAETVLDPVQPPRISSRGLSEYPYAMPRIFEALGATTSRGEVSPAVLPFGPGDLTAGAENELQAVVIGDKRDVDLPRTIEASNYFANLAKRAAAGDVSSRALTDLRRFLDENPGRTWENSWVRIPAGVMSAYACRVFNRDMLADKDNPSSGARTDVDKFTGMDRGRPYVRVPVSYLIKLALADVVGFQDSPPGTLVHIGERLMRHLLNDNTSPESFSFNVVSLRPERGMGRALARETGKRYLLTQLLVQYANVKFRLRELGQETRVYFSPHPPVRQKALNECITDSFYRELFMSPCLSGWSQGEVKHRYMHLCHQVLSRSQLNALAKLREAGIIRNNLVVLPTTSNISLANNRTT